MYSSNTFPLIRYIDCDRFSWCQMLHVKMMLSVLRYLASLTGGNAGCSVTHTHKLGVGG